MAIPPNIPTSFVPKQAIQASSIHARRHGANPINIVAPTILAVAALAAGAVYGYEEYLTRAKTKSAAELTAKEQGINQQAVEEFIRLRDRLSVGTALLNDHVMLSVFLERLAAITLQNVRFESFSVLVNPDKTAEIKMTGTAKNFNALASQSTALSTEPAIRRAIFSNVRQAADGTVSFSLTATLAKEIVTLGNSVPSRLNMPAAVSVPVSTSTSTVPAATMPGSGTATSTGQVAPTVVPKPMVATSSAATTTP